MATPEVYNSTTVAEPKSNKWFVIPTETLDKFRCCVKVVEVLLSLVAFILEEAVTSCISCTALYFFEFVSCTAFLFTLLLLILLSTNLHMRVGISCWPKLDLGYTAVITFLFLIASIVFCANSQSAVERTAVAFGFLSTLAFALDMGLFMKNNGFPWRTNRRPETNGAATPAAETERLNTGANRTE